jgi:hypothetical protein
MNTVCFIYLNFIINSGQAWDFNYKFEKIQIMVKGIKVIISVLIFGIMFHEIHARVIEVHPGENLNDILNNAVPGDTVLVKSGTYSRIRLTDKNFSELKPLVVKVDDSEKVIIKGNTVAGNSSLEMVSCSYIVFEGFAFTNSMWGIYVKNSNHIILRYNEIYLTGQEGCHVGRSSKYVDIIGNIIHNTGLYNPKWAEGIYVGSGSYGRNGFPDNCEYIWIEGNHIYETGKAEAINVKGECFHVTVRNNNIHDIHPGTSEQYNQAAITVEGAGSSITHNYRLSENRDIWVENNTIRNVSDGHLDWNNGIMFFGTGVYILNNTISNCTNKGIFGNNWKNLGHQNYVFGNTISKCGTNMFIHPDVKVNETNPGKNPHFPQKWYIGF